MRVVLDARTLDDHFPGIGRYTFHLAQALDQVAPDLDLTLVVNPRARSTRFPPLEQALPHVRLIPVPHSPFAPQSQWLIPRLVRHLRPDLYHSPYYVLPYLTPGPVVLTVHDTIPTRFPAYFSPPRRLLIRTLKRVAIRRACWLLADSATTARDVITFFGADPARVTVAPLAPASQFRPQPPDVIAALRARYQLPERYVLYLGSDKPHKNLTTLLQAWPQLAEEAARGPGLLLVLAGPLSSRPPWSTLPAVRVLGPVPEADLPALYAGARAFLFPSLYEGFGLPALEAMACGTPVLCSRVPALVETMGDAAVLLSPTDSEAWARALHRVLMDDALCARLSERGLDHARTFTWECTARLTVEAYESACSEKGQPVL